MLNILLISVLVPAKDPTFNYYQQFCQLTIANMVIQQQV